MKLNEKKIKQRLKGEVETKMSEITQNVVRISNLRRIEANC